MSNITTAKLAEITATIVAGMMSNPANGPTEMDVYNLGNTISNVLQQVGQGLNQAGITVVDKG